MTDPKPVTPSATNAEALTAAKHKFKSQCQAQLAHASEANPVCLVLAYVTDTGKIRMARVTPDTPMWTMLVKSLDVALSAELVKSHATEPSSPQTPSEAQK